jgi:hypothetical protein
VNEAVVSTPDAYVRKTRQRSRCEMLAWLHLPQGWSSSSCVLVEDSHLSSR